MRKLATLAALATVALAAPATAQEVTGTVDIDGSVADRCLFTTDNAVISVGELALQGSGTTAGKLDTSKLDGETRTLVGWCNGTAATMDVEAFALENVDFTISPPSGFDRRIDFTATAVANAESADDSSTDDGPGSAVDVGLFTGNIEVTLSGSSSPTGGLLVAGDYVGQVVVTLTPNVSFGGEGPPL
jgi:hypothetical protein